MPTRATAGTLDVAALLPMVRREVRRIFRRCPGGGYDFDDLVGEGALALADCARRFDPSRGVTLEAFASQRVRGAMIDYIRSHDVLSRYSRERAEAIQRDGGDLGRLHVRRASPDALLGVSDAGPRPDDAAIDALDLARVRRAALHLPPRLARVYRLLFQQELTQQQAAEALGVTASWICIQRREIVEALRAWLAA